MSANYKRCPRESCIAMQIKLSILVFFLSLNLCIANAQSSRSFTFTINYTLQTSCTITGATNETYYVTIPWSGNQTFICSQCASINTKMVDVTSLTVTVSSATFSPNPAGKLVHNPRLRVCNIDDIGTCYEGTSFTAILSAWWEDVARPWPLIQSISTVTVYSGLVPGTYTGSSTVTLSCSD